MADTVTGKAAANLAVKFRAAGGFYAGQDRSIPLLLSAIFQASGVAADQFNRIHAERYSFTGGGVLTVDLSSLTDPDDVAFSLAAPGKVRIFAARVNSATDGDEVLFEPGASNGWDSLFKSGGLIVPPSSAGNIQGGFFLAVAPNSSGLVVDATHRIFTMTPQTSNGFSADLVIAGCDG